MDNSEAKFDPITGQPIKNINSQQTQNSQESIQAEIQNTSNSTQDNIQSIATVDQSNSEFINNTQANLQNQNTESKEKTSYVFIIILFAIIFAAIFFLFPLISKYI